MTGQLALLNKGQLTSSPVVLKGLTFCYKIKFLAQGQIEDLLNNRFNLSTIQTFKQH